MWAIKNALPSIHQIGLRRLGREEETHGLGPGWGLSSGYMATRQTGGIPKASKAVCVAKSTDNVLCYAPSRPHTRERGDAS